MKKSHLYFLFMVCGLFLLGIPLHAQQKNITGTVRDESGNPLAGVTVSIKGSEVSTQTNDAGYFSITASPGQTVQFSYIGYALQEVELGQQNSLNMSLAPSDAMLTDVVVVGYGTQRRENLTGAVATVDVNRTLDSRPTVDLARSLQGAVAGMTITTPSGEIGTNPSIRLRGLSGSLNGPGAVPLILVDGVEFTDLRLINPEDIESISVLKDAASASIYGTRAAWGVVLITTKSGKKGTEKMSVTYSNNFSWNTPTTVPEIAPAYEGAVMAMKANQRTNPNATQWAVVGAWYDAASVEKMKEWQEQYGGQDLGTEMVLGRDFDVNGNKVYFYRSWDPRSQFLREWSPQQSHNITMSGSNAKTGYTLGLGFVNQEGVLKANPDKFKRFNVNLGMNSSVTDWMDIHAKVMLTKAEKTTPFLFSSATYDPWYYVTRWPAFYPYGTYEGKPFRSAITEVEQAKMTPIKDNLARIQLGSTFKIIKGLTLDANYTYTNVNGHEHQTGGSITAYNFWASNGLNYSKYSSPSFDRAVYISDWSERNAAKLFATYTGSFGEHDIKLIAGADAELFKSWWQRSERRNLLNPDMGEPNLATGDQFVGSARSHWSTLGYVGRINYSFMDKYLVEVNGRYDGSSSFPVNDQWAFFPSFSVGYKISEESFMDFVRPTLSTLKFRASWGTVGNQAVGGNRFLRVMSSSNSGWVMGGVNTPTVTTPGLVSPSLTWERVTTLDVGVDARFLNERLGISFDWYRRTTSDMIGAGLTVPSSLGTGAPVINFGELQTTGWEITADWNHQFESGIKLNLMAVLSDFKEEITKFSNTTKSINSNYEGRVLGEIWGYETDRYFTNDDFEQGPNGELLLDASGHYIPKAGVPTQKRWEASWFFYGPGDIKYKDLNNDGVIDIGTNTVGDAGDQRIIGNSTPRYQYGFRVGAEWKGFDLSMYIQGVGKRDFWANGPVFIPGYRPGEGWFEHQLDYWTPENPNAYYPRPTDQGQSNATRNFLPQTKYMLNMAYTRLKNINIGYTLPVSLSTKANIKKVRVYVSGENLLTLDKLDIPIDPEVNYTSAGLNDTSTFGRAYPFHKSVSFGLQVTL